MAQKSPSRTPDADADVPPVLGLRERGKLEKLRRIKNAAREVFREKGYEAATTREIAARAEVAYATLFNHVGDKRELIMMLVNEDLDAMTDQAFEGAAVEGPLIDQIVEFFRPRFEYWRREREFSRYVMRESFESLANAEETGKESALFRARRPELMAKLADLVSRKQEVGRIGRHADAKAIARVFMAIYQSEIKEWLETRRPEIRTVMARMRQLLTLIIAGLEADPAEWGGTLGARKVTARGKR
jgi:AcrR family transcriptional regulator